MTEEENGKSLIWTSSTAQAGGRGGESEQDTNGRDGERRADSAAH